MTKSSPNFKYTFLKALTAFFVLLFAAVPSFAGDSLDHHGEEHHDTMHVDGHGGGHKPFNPGELVIGHIKDSHEWHLWGSHDHPVSIPLPIILYNTERGLSVFMSSKFDHGKKEYDGYKIHHDKIYSTDGTKFYDLSITKNVAAMLISIALMLFIFIRVAKAYQRGPGQAPRGLQNAIEQIIIFVRDDIAKAAIGEKHYARFMPYLLTIFFFIWINNLLGLIPIFPGGANVTGNIAIPLVLAVFTLIITLAVANRNYWQHIFAMPGVPVYVLPVISLLEFIGIFLKPFVLMVRLFANIMAGHIVILVFFCLIFVASAAGENTVAGYITALPAVAFTIFINALELLVGFLQAFVFTFLSAIYFGMAVVEHHDHAHEKHH